MKSNKLSEKQRIDALALRLGVSIRKLSKLVELSEMTLYHISDKTRYGITERTASKICYNLESKLGVSVNRNWLLTGEGEMFNNGMSVPVKPYPMAAENNTVKPQAAEETAEYQAVDWKEKYYQLLEKYMALLESHQK